jgi:hypothetical protein
MNTKLRHHFCSINLLIFKNKKMSITEISVKMVLDRWNASIKNADVLLGVLSDEQLEKEIAPNKNRGIYLLGHLIAVHDDLIRLLDLGDKLYPELFEPFIKSADKAVDALPSVAELRTFWTNQNEVLAERINSLSIEEWFQKHTAVTSEDYAKEPHRNKLNIIITRTSHLQYHLGQLVLLK